MLNKYAFFTNLKSKKERRKNKMSKKSTKVLNKLAEKVLKTNMTGTTSFVAYQPAVPANAKQFLDKKADK